MKMPQVSIEQIKSMVDFSEESTGDSFRSSSSSTLEVSKSCEVSIDSIILGEHIRYGGLKKISSKFGESGAEGPTPSAVRPKESHLIVKQG